jgi:hypothetical protein
MVARVTAQLHKNLELTGGLLGDLGAGRSSITNILIAPQYLEMRLALVGALSAFPEARLAVAQVLHTIEQKAAAEITADTSRPIHSRAPS